MNRVATKPAVLSLAISAALAGLSWQAAAEQAQSSAIESKTAVQPEQQAAAKNDKDVEVIQVSGIRSSIKESLFQKQKEKKIL